MDRLSIFCMIVAVFVVLMLGVYLIVRCIELVRWFYSQRPSVLARDNFERMYPMMSAASDSVGG